MAGETPLLLDQLAARLYPVGLTATAGIACRRLVTVAAEGFDVSDQCVDLFITELIRGHHRFITRGYFGFGLQNRFPKIGFIHDHGAAVGELFLAAPQAPPTRTQPLAAIGAVTGKTAVALGQLPTLFHLRIDPSFGHRPGVSGLLCQPLAVVRRTVHYHPTGHIVVGDAAVLGAQNLVATFGGRRKPEIGDLPRHHIHLGAKLRYVKIVQHIQ